MQKFDTLIPLAEQEIARLIATGNKARDGDGKASKPPRPPAYVKARRTRSKLYKNNPMTRQLRLGI